MSVCQSAIGDVKGRMIYKHVIYLEYHSRPYMIRLITRVDGAGWIKGPSWPGFVEYRPSGQEAQNQVDEVLVQLVDDQYCPLQ